MVNFANFTDTEWSPEDYLRDYYRSVEPDERETIKFTVREFQKIRGQPIALEMGIGPTLHRVLALSPHAKEIHVADYLQSNLQKVFNWVNQESTADDWKDFTHYILECEGNENPSSEQIAERERLTRDRLRQYYVADATKQPPLMSHYAAIVSCYCADAISADRAVWAAAMRNIISLVSPGGFFLTAALRNCRHYRVGSRDFPCADINEADVQQVLVEYGIEPATITLEVAFVPEHRPIGYDSIILASGFVAA